MNEDDRVVVACSGTLPGRLLFEFLQVIRDYERRYPQDVHLMIRCEAMNASTAEMKGIIEALNPPFLGGVQVYDVPFICENCKGGDFLEGPRGGLAVNFCCGTCWARYNDNILSIDRDGFVEEEEKHFFHKTAWYPVRRDRA